MKQIPTFALTFLFLLGLSSAQGQIQKKLKKRQDGKYVYMLQGAVYSTEKSKVDNITHWIEIDHIPVGTKLKIINAKINQSVDAVVVGSLRFKDPKAKAEFVAKVGEETSRELFIDSYKNTIKISYVTSLDSSLKEISTLTQADQLLKYRLLAQEFKKYQPNYLQHIPAIDSLKALLPSLPKAQKEEIYAFFVRFWEQSLPKKVIPYLQKLLKKEEQEGGKAQEADYWLQLGDAVNALVDEQIITYNNFGDARYSDKVAQAIAKKTGYSAKEIIRWNRFGDYFPSFNLGNKFRVYPNVEQFSDKEYLQYLHIKQTEKNPDGIAWGLKKLGDLHRLKSGYAQAETYYRQIETLRKKGKDQDKLAWIWGYLAKFYWEQKKYKKAEAYFKNIYNLRQATKDKRRVIWALGGLRYLRYTQGKPEEALAFQRQILEFYEQLNIKERGYLLVSVISNYLWVFPAEKELILNYLIKWLKEINERPQTAEKYEEENRVLSQKISSIAQRLGKYSLAAESLVSVLPTQEDLLLQLNTLNNIAFLYQKNRNYPLSKKYYLRGLKNARKSGSKIHEVIQYYKVGYFYEVQSQSKKASKYYKKSLKLLKKIPKNYAKFDAEYLFSSKYLFKGKSYKYIADILIDIAGHFQASLETQFLKEYIRVFSNAMLKNRVRYLLKNKH